MKFNFITVMSKEAMDFAKEETKRHNIEIEDVQRTKYVENIWGQMSDAYVFKCKGYFEDMIRLKRSTERKFKIWEGLTLI